MTDLRQLNLNLLLVLHHLLSTEGVSSTARRLGRTQSAISHHLATLRAIFDDPLLVATGREMRRTPLANRLRPRVQATIEAIDAVFSTRNAFEPQTAERAFHVAASISVSWLGALLATMAAAGPALRLHVDTPPAGGMDPLLDALATRLSAAFVIAPPYAPGVHSHALPEEPFMTVLGPGVSVDDMGDIDGFCALEHVLLAPYGGGRGIIDTRLETLGRVRRLRATVRQFGALGPALSSAAVVTTVPASAARWLQSIYGLRIYPPPIQIPPLRPALIWHARTHTDPAEVWFRSILIDTLNTSRHQPACCDAGATDS